MRLADVEVDFKASCGTGPLKCEIKASVVVLRVGFQVSTHKEPR